MKTNPAGNLTRKFLSILTILSFMGSTFAGSGTKPVHAQFLSIKPGEAAAVDTPNFFVFLAKDGSLWDIHGYHWPLNTPVTMTLDNPPLTPGTPDYTRVAYMEVPPWGGDAQLVYDISGMSVVPGAEVTMSDGTTNLAHTVTNLHVTQVNAITDSVTGTADPGSEVQVVGNGGWTGRRRETVAGNGTWTADFSQPGDEAGEAVADIYPGLDVISTQNNGGGTTAVAWGVPDPWFYIWLDKNGSLSDFHGYDWPLDTPVVMTLDNPPLTPGAPDFTRVATMEVPPWGGSAQLVYDISGMSVVPGAQVTMTDGITTYLTHTVPALHVTDVNPDTDIVTGTAEPFSELWVAGDPGGNWPGNRHEIVAADGSWTADFSQPGDEPGEVVADITPGLTVVSQQTNGGGSTAVVWPVPNDQGVITGTVHDLSDTPITGVAIDVTANYSGGSLSTCTNPTNGTYQITGLPLNDPITVSANANGGCDNNNYGWETWQHVTVQDPTPITLTNSAKVASGIDFSLGSATYGIEYLYFNLNRPGLNDLAVRQAIAYGTDRQGLLDQVWRPSGIRGTVQNSYLPDYQWGHAPNSALTLYPYNPDLARSTLTAAGWIDSDLDGIREKNGQELSFNFKTTWNPTRRQAGAAFVAEMQAIGIALTPYYLDPSLFNQWPDGSFWKSDFDIAELANLSCGSQEDTTCVPFPWFVTGNARNVMGYSSAVADSIFASANSAGNLVDKQYYVIQHQVIISHDLPVLPLFTRVPGFVLYLPVAMR